MNQREFNATADGQRAMCADASSRAPVFLMNKFVREHGGEAWSDSMIASANATTLAAISEDVRAEYNRLTSPGK